MPRNSSTASPVEVQDVQPVEGEQEVQDVQTAKAAPVDPGEELITVELFYDGDKYKDPVPVIVNGVKILVPRGKPVKIKRKYAEVLDHSAKQDKSASLMMDSMVNEFEAESQARNIKI